LIEEYAKAKGVANEPNPQIRQKSTASFIDALDKRIAAESRTNKGYVKAIYALLSDICHPSVGGDLMFLKKDRKH
jgi:hypothetical protein